ncbi:TIGR03086 family metal-binding protein [Streptomyces sp. NBC_01353]|uniref:TIGR03086 family metal-binding protein n=1 Tax=Streptomyces sp. NBC_01353 TaxID=2903835 RepID=UPI002E2ED6C7|nr:TIGR03086 family metal-binding protein [Streptomyces sp. NBC_01353]
MRISSEGAGPTERFERLRLLHARVVRDSVALMHRVTPGDLGRPTPCAGWTVADLLAHMTAQHRGFAAAALGDGADLAHWSVHPVTDTVEAVARYAEAAADVGAAFAALDAPDRPFLLPEFTVDRTFPADRAVGFHFIDYVVHGWDITRGLDLPYDPEPDILDAALPIALSVPDGDTRLAPDSPFRPGIPLPPGAATLDRILATLGRTPDRPTGGH